jgi:hypothetical protein
MCNIWMTSIVHADEAYFVLVHDVRRVQIW